MAPLDKRIRPIIAHGGIVTLLDRLSDLVHSTCPCRRFSVSSLMATISALRRDTIYRTPT